MHIIELGPGRGTLLADVLRTVNQFSDMRGLIRSATLIEVSEKLRGVQAKTLAESHCQIGWAPSIEQVATDQLKDSSLILIAHEFFDALPIHAFKRLEDNIWREIPFGRAGSK